MAGAVEANAGGILRAKEEAMRHANLPESMRGRLLLTPERMKESAGAVRNIAALPDPVGEVLEEWDRPNGLRMRKIRVPLGVLGIVYESRPNVTVDAAALAFKSGNAAVLRGGKEAARSNQALAEALTSVRSVPCGAIELLDSSTRESVQDLITARGLVDVVIPRGGPELISHVVENAIVPVSEPGAVNCHIFVDESANLDMASRIVLNAKTQRPSVCNAAEKLLVHASVASVFIPRIVRELKGAGVELRGDQSTIRLVPGVSPATEEDWSEEYLRLCMAIRVVPGVEEAIEHINCYSTKHSEAIVTANEDHARKFLRLV